MSQEQNIFEWDNEKFTTYVGAMDREHKVLVDLMNQLYRENEKGAERGRLLSIATQLGQKTKEHFSNEEKFFSGLKNYTSANSHKKIHEALLMQFTDHIEKFQRSQDTKVNPEFFRFLKVWLMAHICGVDRKYGEIAKAGSK